MKPKLITLNELLDGVCVQEIAGPANIPVNGICFNSSQAGPGFVFVAVKGEKNDGHRFIDDAINRGAGVVVCHHIPEVRPDNVVFVCTENSAAALGHMCSAFYGNPSQKLRLTGVTGTNGKTTIATLLFRLFRELGFGCGLISTVCNKVNDEEIPATHTTPDPVQLNRLLAQMVDQGCEYCFMEVSSHAVVQDRIAGLKFTGGIFTNITHDHLDYHRTFDNYLRAKKAFFDGLGSGAFALVNDDDRNGRVMLQNTLASRYTYSLRSMADFRCRITENQFSGLQLMIGGKEVWCRLVGHFNAYNLLAIYAAAVLLGQAPDDVLTILSGLEAVEGRFQTVRDVRGTVGIVDYAHTPDALENVLETISSVRNENEKIITVVGAGGNRDPFKRPVMARIAATLSDHVILTSDNPRNENPADILSEMSKGVEGVLQKKVLVIENRREAIRTAYALSAPGDIILIAGKGHEKYQEIKGVKHHFDDMQIIQELMEK